MDVFYSGLAVILFVCTIINLYCESYGLAVFTGLITIMDILMAVCFASM